MLNLNKKLKTELDNKKNGEDGGNSSGGAKKISIRDKLLVKEVQDLQSSLPSTCNVQFPDPNKLHEFELKIRPDEGDWKGGMFAFSIMVGDEYNFAPPLVKCKTMLWHPNINEEGSVCLSLLRQSSIDELGWAPTRTLKDVVWGLNSLFTDLLNFEDPLNIEAAEQFSKDPQAFKYKVSDYIRRYCSK